MSFQIISYTLLLSVLEYQTLVMRGDFETANTILPNIPRDQLARVAQFLEKQGFKKEALDVTTDMEHKFELALNLNKLKLAFEIVDNDKDNSTEQKWKQIADAATKSCDFKLAQECMVRAHDYGSLLLLASSTGNRSMMETLTVRATEDGQQNIAFLSKFLLNDLNGCLQLLLDSNRFSEAGFFCRAYLPTRIPEVVELWKKNLAEKANNKKVAEALANPAEYPNLFPGYEGLKNVEEYLRKMSLKTKSLPAEQYLKQKHMWERNPAEELRENHDGLDTEEIVTEKKESEKIRFEEDDEIEKEINEGLSKDWDEDENDELEGEFGEDDDEEGEEEEDEEEKFIANENNKKKAVGNKSD